MDYGADQITDPERTKSKIISNETENIGTHEIEIEIWKYEMFFYNPIGTDKNEVQIIWYFLTFLSA